MSFCFRQVPLCCPAVREGEVADGLSWILSAVGKSRSEVSGRLIHGLVYPGTRWKVKCDKEGQLISLSFEKKFPPLPSEHLWLERWYGCSRDVD